MLVSRHTFSILFQSEVYKDLRSFFKKKNKLRGHRRMSSLQVMGGIMQKYLKLVATTYVAILLACFFFKE